MSTESAPQSLFMRLRRRLEALCLRKGRRQRAVVASKVPIVMEPDGEWLILEDGVRLKSVYAMNSVSSILMSNGTFEKTELEIVRKYLRHGAVFVDVGANVGYYSILVAHWFRNVRIHAFEPVPDTCLVFRENLRKNGFDEDSITINPMAAGRENKTVHVTTEFHSSNYVTDAASRESTLEVQCVALDAYFKDRRVKGVDFIKIDAEGKELDVLEGARETLQTYHPNVLVEFVENPTCFHDRVVDNYRESISLMRCLGYEYSVVDDRDRIIPMDALQNGVFNNSFHNYFFTRRGIHVSTRG